MKIEDCDYKELEEIFYKAYEQSAKGKGKERHATEGVPWVEQPIIKNTFKTGVGGPIFQVLKKAEEGLRLPPNMAIEEYLGAINYLAAAIYYLEHNNTQG